MSADEVDNDPKVFLSDVAKALDAVEPIGERVFGALGLLLANRPNGVMTAPRTWAILVMATEVSGHLGPVAHSGVLIGRPWRGGVDGKDR